MENRTDAASAEGIDLEVLSLGNAVTAGLRLAGIQTVGALSAMSDDELLAELPFGQTSLTEVRESVSRYWNRISAWLDFLESSESNGYAEVSSQENGTSSAAFTPETPGPGLQLTPVEVLDL